LAVDNLTGTKVLGRSLRVDHCEQYRLPKELLEKEEKLANMTDPGHAYQDKELANTFSIQQGQDLFAKPAPVPVEEKRERVPKGERKEAKQKRKEERSQHRKEREEKREKKEEKKREKRAKRYQDGGDDDREKRHKKKRRKEDRPRED
jgi:RNA-binding motif X-linked protein 2